MNLFIIIILFIEYILVKCLYSDYYINNVGEREYPKEYQVTIKLWVFVMWVGGSLAASSFHIMLGIVVSILILLFFGMFSKIRDNVYFYPTGIINSILRIKIFRKLNNIEVKRVQYPLCASN